MSEENVQIVKKLVLKRGQIKAQLTKFQNFLATIVLPQKLFELKMRKQNVESLLKEFQSIQLELEMLDSETDHASETDLFENKYFELMGLAESKLQDSNNSIKDEDSVASPSRSSTPNVSSNDSNMGIKLPDIKLPEFSGNFDTWISFQESFTSLIHNNEKLTSIQKFFYLKSVLKDEALKVINNLDVSAANYRVAWGLLVDRYENKKLIVHSHLKAIFELPIVSKENYNSLRLFLDTFLLNFRALKSLNDHAGHWDAILLYLLNSKLDIKTKREWEGQTKDNSEPRIDEFVKFLNNKCQLLQTIDNKTSFSSSKDYKRQEYKPASHVNTNNNNNMSNRNSNTASYVKKCIFCSGTHLIYFCDKFLSLPINARYEQVKKLRVCLNCLKPGHIAVNCNSSACKKCHRKHNSLIHFENKLQTASKREIPTENSASIYHNQVDNIRIDTAASGSDVQQPYSNNAISTTLASCILKENYVLLATATVFITNRNGKWIRCRALLDNASQSNFISANLFNKLGLKYHKIDFPVTSLNNTLNSISKITTCTFNSLYGDFSQTAKFLVVEKITEDLPQIEISMKSLRIPPGLNMADPEFYITKEIELLIGAQIFWDLLQVGQIKLCQSGPVLQKSRLGWLISGPIPQNSNAIVCNLNISNDALSKQMERFWETEEIPTTYINSLAMDDDCERHFVNNYSRDPSGRFVVKLPFSKSPKTLGESKHQAIQRLLKLERKFDLNPELASEYKKFMTEYEELKHMKQIDIRGEEASSNYYLPHHCVVKGDSLTTKYRVVFDASAKTNTNISLNEILMVGPCIQDDLFSILIRFRLHNVVLVADISKMYRQVKIHESDHKFQRIVWRKNSDEEIKVYELQTLTYGTAPASFIATRCLKQVALDNIDTYPFAAEVIQHSFYMDDLLTGASDIQEAKNLKSQLERVLSGAGFELRKWISNQSSVFTNLEGSDQSYYIISEHNEIKTLGVMWDSKEDKFNFLFKDSNLKMTQISKRTVLSVIARIFDPIGLLSPIIMKAKCFMQKLWQIKIDWDQTIPLEMQTDWLNFYKQLPLLNNMSVKRQITSTSVIECQLHGFSDASELGFGACVYLRVIDKDGNITSRLVCSKSRVAPIKTLSIPRLELNGALVLAKLMNKVMAFLNINVDRVCYWCDSTIVLQWLSKPSSTWKVYVSHRVSAIQQLSNIEFWSHVPTGENPADIISRGCFPSQLENNVLWWNGPQWLIKDVHFWPPPFEAKGSAIPLELKSKPPINLSLVSTDNSIFDRFSSYNRLIRVVAWIMRFSSNSRLHPEGRNYSPLTISECQNSVTKLCKLVQLEFANEFISLKNNKPLKNKSKLLSLNPFLDQDDLIRVGGRLRHSNLAYDQCHPIILPSKHQLSKLIIRAEHHKNLHANAQLVLSQIRQRFWILNGKQSVRSELRKCVTCFKVKPLDNSYQMGDLPKSRVIPSRIFSAVGIDFAGPYWVKDGRLKNRKLVKSYFCIFICMATKAVHLEAVGELSADGFLNTLKRFVSRRGLCSDIFSDNATNFIGADNQMKRLTQIADGENFQNYLLENKIRWHYIPARSPHFGGIWEAAVRSAKYYLKRIAINIHFTYEEFHTLLCQIESILNSRPLLPLSNDPTDLDILTPGHFIIGSSMRALPQANVQDKPCNLLRRYELLQKLTQQFWAKWSKDYLNSLQQRTKWQRKTDGSSIQVGALVMLKEDNTVPQQWPLGRIVMVHPGSDSVKRVVTVKTANGEVKRAVNRVCVLPMETVGED